MADEKKDPGVRVDAQSESLLFQRVPQEIRDNIYALLFSTRVTFGARRVTSTSTVWIKPAPNGLAILRACRRTKLEIGDSWLSRLLFCFEDPYTMLDRLTVLPRDTLSKIRHLRISGDRLVYMIWGGDDEYYYLDGMLKLLPGLQLDQLTVLGTRDFAVSYETLLGLFYDSAGWKTLRFISPHSLLVGFPGPLRPENHQDASDEEAMRYRFRRSHRLWQSILEGRDGLDSSPSVTVYRAREHGDHHCMFDPDRRVNWAEEPFSKGEDPPELNFEHEGEKESMFIAERGAGVDYEEKEGSPFIKRDPRRHPNKRIWPKMENVLGTVWKSQRRLDDGPGRVDVFKDVDEYAWPYYSTV
jgi:hypothetical protein